jgi:hypothetical protein
LSPFPPAKPNNKTSGIVSIPTDLTSETHHVTGTLLGGLGLFDDIHDLLIQECAANTIRHHDQEREFSGAHLDPIDLWLGGYANTLRLDISKCACICESTHALFAEGIGDKGRSIAAESCRLDR